MKRTFYFLTLFLTGFLFLLACVDNNEEPPPDIPFRAGQVVTVDQVKALYSQELAKPWKERHPVQIMEDWASGE